MRIRSCAGIALLVLVVLGGCRSTSPSRQPVLSGPTSTYTLRILHINDHHSRLDADSSQQLLLDGEATDVSLGGFPRVVSAFRERAEGVPHVLRLHAGDALSGDLYHTLFKGEADADLMNQVCFDAFVPGNHEFDQSDVGLKVFLDFLSKRLWDCHTPVTAANVRPQTGLSPLRQFDVAAYLQPHVVVERGGRRIGIVGVVIAQETRDSSSPLHSTEFIDEAQAAQQQIDVLRAAGVDIIVVLSHVGYGNDLKLASQLSGVDVIVGGHSHSPLGDGLAALGVVTDGPYPTLQRNRDGDTVCVVQAWQYGWALGELDLEFDPQGRVLRCGGQVHLLLGEDFRRQGAPVDAATRARIQAQVEQVAGLAQFAPDERATQVLEFYAQRKREQALRVVAHAEHGLCLRRAPAPYDRGRDGRPGCAERTDAQGGEVQALVSAAALAAVRNHGGAEIALQNGGGSRSSIAAGPFSVGDAFNVLPFRNTLVIVELSGAELAALLNSVLDYIAEDPHTRTGSYPYAAGLRWKVDLSAPAGQRLRSLELWQQGQASPVLAEQRYKVVVSDYLASGRDGYGLLQELGREGRIDTSVDMAEALIDYIVAQDAIAPPAAVDRSTQGFVGAE